MQSLPVRRARSCPHICKLNINFNTRISLLILLLYVHNLHEVNTQASRRSFQFLPTVLALIINCKSNARTQRTTTTMHNRSGKKGNQLCKRKKRKKRKRNKKKSSYSSNRRYDALQFSTDRFQMTVNFEPNLIRMFMGIK